MTGERTEKPTAKKLRDARREGRVPRSADFGAVAVLAGAFVTTALTAPAIGERIGAYTRQSIALAARPTPSEAALANHLLAGVEAAAIATAPILVTAFVVAAVVGYLQVGPVFALKPIIPQLERMSPANGLQRLWSVDRLVDLAKNSARLTILFAIAAGTAGGALAALLLIPRGTLEGGVTVLGRVALDQAAYLVGALFVFALIDLIWQRHRFFKEQMMTKAEVREEHKSSEGDPQLRARRKQAHREILQSAGVSRVRDADAVVVNPTHAAAALRYREEEREAPFVVAAGRGELARAIRREATRHRIPIVRDVRLAQSLADLDVDAEIPEQLYEAVAEVLHFVYSLEERT